MRGMEIEMGRQIRRRRDYRKVGLITSGIFVAVALFVFLSVRFKVDEEVEAVSLVNFDPGYIISDYQMSNYNTMTVAEIQSFLSAKGSCNNTKINQGVARGYEDFSDASGVAYNYYIAFNSGTWRYHVENGHFVCLADEKFNGQSAAEVIYEVAQEYRINPQVLIVLLQKEQGLITDSYPNNAQYRGATGYGCPDTAACDAKYYGFKNQVRNAAAMFRTVLDGGWTNYPLGNNYVQYNPSASCGGSVVNIRSLATSALYRYTPYQPNASALAAGYGLGDACGAYGNRNFYLYFGDWFGDPTDEGELARAPLSVRKAIEEHKAKLGSAKNTLQFESDGRIWQTFENGTVIYHENTGANIVYNGEVADKWAKMGGSNGSLGKPKNDTTTESDGRIWQTFEKGTIIYHKDTGVWAVMNSAVADKWAETGGSYGSLGKPKYDTTWTDDGRIWQTFEKGTIIYKMATGAHVVMDGPIADKWAVVGGSLGVLGVPVGEQEENETWIWQEFKNGGMIYLKNHDRPAISLQDAVLYEAWKSVALDNEVMTGLPISMQYIEADGRHWQTYENGTLIYHVESGGYMVMDGPIAKIWAENGGSLGKYGRPISNQTVSGNIISQEFLRGTIEVESE